MAQGTLVVFEEFTKFMQNGDHKMDTDTFKIALITTLPVKTQTTPDLADFTEVSGGGYTAGGEALGTVTLTEAGGVTTWDSPNTPSWTQNGSGPTDIKSALGYNTTHGGTNDAVFFIDMTVDGGTTPISLQSGDISITFSGSGIYTTTV